MGIRSEFTMSDHELSDDSDTEVKETLQQMDNMDDEEEVQDDSIAQVKIIKPQLNEEQLERWDKFRSVSFSDNYIKDFIASTANKKANAMGALVMAGITKVFVGEMVETARSAMDEWNETGPIQPRHLREAYRRLKMANKILYYKQRRRVLRRNR